MGFFFRSPLIVAAATSAALTVKGASFIPLVIEVRTMPGRTVKT